MKEKLFALAFCALAGLASVNAQIKIGGKTIDTKKVVNAAADAHKAITLSDADVAELCREAVVWMDDNNPIADGTTEYGQRLERLVGHITEVNGVPLNFKVYHVIDVNAFACGDGSIRIFSSLMDVMDDDELMAIIGHEIGHVINTDTKDAMKTAYAASAAKNALGATGGKLAKLSNTELGDLALALTDSQFSQKQEFAADEYGFKFCVDNGYSPYGMANSLQKLVDLFESGGEKSSIVQKMFSSHPDSKNRATRMRAKADEYSK